MIGMVHRDGTSEMPMLQGLGQPIAHGHGLYGPGLGVPITPIYGFGQRRWDGYESLSGLGHDDPSMPTEFKVSKFWAIASTVSMAASAYHGYKRNNSVGWALGWGFLGALFPVITPTIGIAQGFAKPKR